MKIIKKLSSIQFLLLGLIFFIASTKTAHAYLDPGTGSYILQILAAGILGGLFAVKTFWHQITTFLMDIFSGKKKISPRKKINNAEK